MTTTTTKNRMSAHNKIRLKKDFPRNSVLDALMIIMIIIMLIIDKNDYGIFAHQSQLGTNKVLIEQNKQQKQNNVCDFKESFELT